MPPFIPAIISGLSSLFGGFFNWKSDQAQTVQKAIEAIGNIDNNDAKSTAATADALQIILSQGSWLEKNWRSFLMTALSVIVVCSFFGYTPSHLNDTLSPMMERIFNLLEVGLSGYIVRRGIVDVVRMFNISSILKTLINKKIT